jgi:hypothetical protein
MVGMIPRYVRKNVIRGMAAIWTRPQDDTATLPSNALALGGDWSTPATGNALWTPIGASESGATLRFSRATNDISIEEQLNPVDIATTSIDPRIEVTLAEDTLETMKLAYGGGTITTVAAASGVPGYRELKIAQDIDHLTIGLEGMNTKNQWRRILMLDVLSVADVETSYRNSETQRLYAVSFRLVSPIDQMLIREWNAQHFRNHLEGSVLVPKFDGNLLVETRSTTSLRYGHPDIKGVVPEPSRFAAKRFFKDVQVVMKDFLLSRDDGQSRHPLIRIVAVMNKLWTMKSCSTS